MYQCTSTYYPKFSLAQHNPKPSSAPFGPLSWAIIKDTEIAVF